MPSDSLFQEFQSPDFTIADTWTVSGLVYQKTLEAWLDLLCKNRNAVINMFEDANRGTGGKAFNAW